MIALDTIREKLGIEEGWVENGGVWWLNPGTAGVRGVAQAMNSIGARFVTITAYQLPGDTGFRLEYHWDIHGCMLGIPFQISGSAQEGAKIDSIFDLCEAADWIEREVYEGFAIEFIGREYEPLLLRKGDAPGVNLRETAPPGKPASGLQGQEEVKK